MDMRLVLAGVTKLSLMVGLMLRCSSHMYIAKHCVCVCVRVCVCAGFAKWRGLPSPALSSRAGFPEFPKYPSHALYIYTYVPFCLYTYICVCIIFTRSYLSTLSWNDWIKMKASHRSQKPLPTNDHHHRNITTKIRRPCMHANHHHENFEDQACRRNSTTKNQEAAERSPGKFRTHFCS